MLVREERDRRRQPGNGAAHHRHRLRTIRRAHAIACAPTAAGLVTRSRTPWWAHPPRRRPDRCSTALPSAARSIIDAEVPAVHMIEAPVRAASGADQPRQRPRYRRPRETDIAADRSQHSARPCPDHFGRQSRDQDRHVRPGQHRRQTQLRRRGPAHRHRPSHGSGGQRRYCRRRGRVPRSGSSPIPRRKSLEGLEVGEVVVADAGSSLHDGDRIKTAFASLTNSIRTQVRRVALKHTPAWSIRRPLPSVRFRSSCWCWAG